MTSIVIGLGFGDEGKGKTVSYLTSKTPNPMICRFNGGHQAGHTVLVDGKRHVFSSFGSGTLQGAPTFWSKYCTIYPIALMREYEVLEKLGIKPKLYVDSLCPITTPFDLSVNRQTDKKNQHGTVGVGFGATIDRHEKNYKLHAQDLFFNGILRTKLDLIESYLEPYREDNWEEKRYQFIDAVKWIVKNNIIRLCQSDILQNHEVIFEGAQGILLDQTFGFFPHVTRSNTTSKNAMELIMENKLDSPTIYYVTRSYHTRHGVGPFPNENTLPAFCGPIDETNKDFGAQGKFRVGALDLDLIEYALSSDYSIRKSGSRKLVITCTDQTSRSLNVIKKDWIIDTAVDISEIPNLVAPPGFFSEVLIGTGADMEQITTL